MKQILLAMLTIFVLAGCSKEDELKNVTKDLEVEIKVGEVFSLEGTEFTVKTTCDDFIADLSKNGKITGMHDGITEAVVVSGNTTYNCKINVTANTSLYIDLKYMLEFNKSQITDLLGQPFNVSNGVHYFNGKLLESGYMFRFDDKNEVYIAAIVFKSSYAKELGRHLADRYKLVDSKDNSLMFIDANDLDKCKTVVMATTSRTTISVTYAKKAKLDAGTSKAIMQGELIDRLPVLQW